jgi:hypothetical protein
VVVQDRDNACMMKAIGGEYKCWRGFVALSAAPDGRWLLVLGKRVDGGSSADSKATGAKSIGTSPAVAPALPKGVRVASGGPDQPDAITGNHGDTKLLTKATKVNKRAIAPSTNLTNTNLVPPLTTETVTPPAGNAPKSEDEGDAENLDESAVKPQALSGTAITPLKAIKGAASLFRANLEGPYSAAPTLIEHRIEGAAVWVPGR